MEEIKTLKTIHLLRDRQQRKVEEREIAKKEGREKGKEEDSRLRKKYGDSSSKGKTKVSRKREVRDGEFFRLRDCTEDSGPHIDREDQRYGGIEKVEQQIEQDVVSPPGQD